MLPGSMPQKSAKPKRPANDTGGTPLAFVLKGDDAWLAALGTSLLQKFEEEGADILSEFNPKRLSQALRRKLGSAQRAHLDYVVRRLSEWRSIEFDYEGEMPWDPDEPWTGPSYDTGPTRRVLERAIKAGSDVEMDYFTHGRDEFTTRRVTPRELDGRYLVGYCHLRQEDRTFRVERIAKVRRVIKRRRA